LYDFFVSLNGLVVFWFPTFVFTLFDYYYLNLPAITIAQKVIITVISKEELVALLLTKWQLKVSCSSDRLIVLTMRFRYYDHNIAIFDCGEGIKIVASKYMFKLIDPLLERRSIESEIKK